MESDDFRDYLAQDMEPSHDLTPQRLFERRWALTLLEVVVGRLEAEFQAANKAKQFELLRDALAGNQQRLPHAEIAKELGMTVEAVRQVAHRMRRRYKTLLREEVARTVVEPGEVDQELMELFESLGN